MSLSTYRIKNLQKKKNSIEIDYKIIFSGKIESRLITNNDQTVTVHFQVMADFDRFGH